MPNLDISTKRNSCAKIMAIAVLALAVSIAPVKAQTNVYTDPVGFITLTAAGTNGQPGAALSYIGLGMTQLVTNRGLLTAASGTQLTVNNTLSPGQFGEGPLGPLYFIEITSGTLAGLTDDIVSNSATAVFTASNDTILGLTGTESYKIYPHWTLASVFGPNDQSGLIGAGTASGADQVIVPIQSAQGFAAYFYNSSSKSGGVGWRLVAGNSQTDYSTQRLYIDQGLLIQKVGATNLNVQLVGAVKLGNTIIPIGGTNNYVGNVYASSGMTLTNSNLNNASPSLGMVGAGTASSADTISIHNDSNGSFVSYFWNSSTKSGGIGWRQVAGNSQTDMGNTSIPLGASVLIQLQPTHGGFNWTAPVPYTP